MCENLWQIIGKLLLSAFFSLLLSVSAWSLDTTSAPSAPEVASSGSLPAGSTSPQALKPLIQPLPEPPQPQTTPLDSSQPVSEQRRQELVKWINFWEQQETPWREQLKTSWTNLKSSFEKQVVDSDAAQKAKDAVISAQAEKIAILTAQLERVNTEKWIFGLLGFLGGAVMAETVAAMNHK